ncbi:hypothetical protein DLAC_05359 [Tieghemostelium lacteum]|uniref:WH2 domain-containing protein n=1 Tax=Tieghemostelium lacteum TaxID=361077 RepID=A0A151ZFY8_TIELA|nr:hypothetical protein DLAC_05359 [Tieghemostelium lacteum]|eukprot:KYQ92780.1 hypothetical protein DLAC_05359 [Tieghemostelium lacteum]
MSVYQVPIVSNGLRETESILQIVDSLEKLEKVFNDIYSNISNRVAIEKNRIDNVSDRLENAQFKVKQITGSKSAITIFSSAKYPAEKKWLDYRPLNDTKQKLPYKPSHYHGLHNDPSLKKKNEDSFLEVNDLVFIEKSIDAASKEIERKEGLGKLPHHLSSVSNLLLFNTSENPYKKYSNTLDNLAGAEGDDLKTIFGENPKKIDDAPITVREGDTMVDPTKENFKFTHSNFIRPSLQFEENLPLPNIAQNISFQNLDNSTIAPSNTNVNPLPIYDQSPSLQSANSTAIPIDYNVPGLAQPMSNETSTSIPIPPPLPNPTNTSSTNNTISLPIPTPQPVNNNIANILPTPDQMRSQDDDDDDDDRPGESDGTSIGDLLADIRKGFKLKKVEEPKSGANEETSDEPPPKSSGGDFMSDLFLSLARRRESIAAVKKKPNSHKEEFSDDDQESDWDDK